MKLPRFCTAALAAWLLAAPGHAGNYETPNLNPGPAAAAEVVVEAPPTSVPATPDFSQVPRAALERLAADLALENLLLKSRAAEESTDPAGEANLFNDPQQLDEAVARLEQRLLGLRLRRAALAEAAEAGASDPSAPADEPTGLIAPPSASAPETPGTAAQDAADEVQGTTKGSAPYRYRYSFGLIGTSGRGRVVVRGENGVLRSDSYNFSEFRDDAVWVKLLFRNDGDTPQRFNGVMALGRRIAAGLGAPAWACWPRSASAPRCCSPVRSSRLTARCGWTGSATWTSSRSAVSAASPPGSEPRVGAAGPG